MWLTNQSSYLFQKRGVYYYSRRVPKDVSGFFQRERIVFSLRTSHKAKAQKIASRVSLKLEDQWQGLRWQHCEQVLGRFTSVPLVAPTVEPAAPTGPLLSKAMEIYLAAKGAIRPKTFTQAVQRAVANLVQQTSDLPIGAYKRAQVNKLRDHLQASGLAPASVRRQLTTLSALVNFASKELGLEPNAAFSGVIIAEAQTDGDTQKRRSIPLETIRAVQHKCIKVDDEARWAIAVVSDSGLRLSEALGLTRDDAVLHGPSPHLLIRTKPHRRLKTAASTRRVPLVGAALWGVKRALSAHQSDFLFPKYCSEAGCRSNSASGALNKWLKPMLPEGCVIHSFRHSFRDRLRAVQCPKDITDRLGGWTVAGVGEGYGEGYPVEVLFDWMRKIE